MTSLTTSSGAIVQGGREYGVGHCLGEEAAIAWCSRLDVFFSGQPNVGHVLLGAPAAQVRSGEGRLLIRRHVATSSPCRLASSIQTLGATL